MLKQDIGLRDLEFITDLSPSESERMNGGAIWTVRKGDSLWSLTGGRVRCIKAIARRNKIKNPNLIKTGENIEVKPINWGKKGGYMC